jgi:hypothetical protein
MDVALDGAAIVDALNDSLRTDDGSRVRSCTPYYVKYKPAKYCVVQYQLELAQGAPARQVAHVGLYPAKRMKKLRTRSHVSTLSSPKLSGILQLYPADWRLPGLSQAASPKSMSHRFRRLWESTGAEVEVRSVALVRYKALKRAVLRYRLDGGPHGAVYGKIRKDGGRDLVPLYRALRSSGASAPDALARFSDLGMIVHAEQRGTRLKDLRRERAYQEWMGPVADTLARLHDTTVDGLRSRRPADQAEELMTAARLAGRLLPGVSAEAEHLAVGLGRALRAVDGDLSSLHGSFHDDQVLVGDNGVFMVDLDSAALGNPLEDVGHFLSYLDADGAHDAAERFLDAYGRVRPVSDDVYVFESASLLRWATLPFRELRTDWPDAVAQRVHQATECLGRYQPGRFTATKEGAR